MAAAYPHLIVTFPGGVGNPSNQRIPLSGGRRLGCGSMRKNRRTNTRKNSRRVGCGLMRKNRRNTRRANRR